MLPLRRLMRAVRAGFAAASRHETRSRGVADAVNLCLLLLGLVLYWRLSAGHLAEEEIRTSLQSLIFYLGQGVFFWYIAAQITALVPLKERGAKVFYALVFTLLFIALVLNYQCYALMRVHIDPSLAQLVLEPGFLADLTIEASQATTFVFLASALFGLQFALASLPVPRSGILRWAAALRDRRSRLLLAAGFLATWTLWSYQNFIDHADANKQVRAAPLFVPRSIDFGLTAVWAGLGVEPDFAPLEKGQIVVQHDRLQETAQFRNHHRNVELPPDLSAEHDWNILILAAESWRWDMFTPEIMPRLWAHARRRGWVSPAHYSTGNSTAEGLYGLFSGQIPFYWFTSYRYRLSPVFFDILKRLGYQTNVLTSSTLGYRSMDEYVFGPNVDSIEMLRVPPPQMAAGGRSSDGRIAARPEAARNPKELWDLAVVEEYLTRLDTRKGTKHFDFLFLYSTHYRYYFPAEFQKFSPVVGTDFALFNLYLKVMAPELLNRYRNAAHYLDYLYSRVIEELERRGELERTIIVITGDHGEEFFEDGRFGHSMSLNDYQTRVPLLLFLPEQARIDYTVTSHADVVPSILTALGTSPSVEHLFTGKNLFDFHPSRNAALVMSLMNRGAPMEFALVRERRKFRFLNRSDGMVVRGTPKDDDGRALDRVQIEEELRYLLALKSHFAAETAQRPSPQHAGGLPGSRASGREIETQ